MQIPTLRVQARNDSPPRDDAGYVLYWMIAQRRVRWNFALQHAAAEAHERGLPLVVFEPLRIGYRWASDRIHAFVLDGMCDNAERLAEHGVTYCAYLEPEAGAGKGLLRALAERAAVVVTDEFPCFFLPRMVEAAAEQLDVRLDVVDGNGMLPLRATDREFTTAHSFRRQLQKTLPDHLTDWPIEDPLDGVDGLGGAVLPDAVTSGEWQVGVMRNADELSAAKAGLASLDIDHEVGVVDETPGGSVAGEARAKEFLDERLSRYHEDRNQPQQDVASGLSPYLHFGHISAHAVVADLFEREEWSPASLAPKATGKREGWWGLSAPAEAFLDEIVTWREVGYVFTHHRPDDYDRFESLPDWSRATLAKHESDAREHVYTLEEFAEAKTHDDLWNAAQTQLVREGKIHNYLRMLWGKKIIEWSEKAEDALEILVELNNRFALDGRNPNSYSGIFWTLGRFDRAWGPERQIFGTVRWMSSANTARKVKVKDYIAAYAGEPAADQNGGT